MRRLVPALVVASAAGLTLLGWAPRSAPRAAEGTAAGGEPAAVTAPRLLGVGSCATAACHNGNAPLGTKGSEYATWVTRDPHARAYAVLSGERSRRIQQNLTGKRESAENNVLCLKCHAFDPGLVPADEHYHLADGVGCEACHGPAEKWRSVHYLPEWKDRKDKADLGFRLPKDLVERADLCVTCHVGTPEREVNHDLIAAGHPRLRFEYGAYLANYPKHWNDAEDRAGRPDFEARAWSIGQVVSARAALELLQSRAAGEKKPWPEFAEYGCFSCHHNLQDRRWRQPAPGGRPPGSLAWGTWYLSLLPVLAGRQPPPQPLELESLEKQMSRTVPDREEVAREAGRVAKLMTGWLKQVAKPPQGEKTLPNLLTALARERPESTSNWDNATQLYLALAAVDQALGEVEGKYRDQPPARAALKDLHDALDRAFPRDQESAYDSPRDYDPTEIDKILGKLREQLRGLGLE